MAHRTCESCGASMPPFERRHRRPDGALVCPSCREPGAGGRPGGGNVFGSRPRAQVVAASSGVQIMELARGWSRKPSQRLLLAYWPEDDGPMLAGGLVFDDAERTLVAVAVHDHWEGRGVARALIEAMDRVTGAQYPDDGHRSEAGEALLTALGRPMAPLKKRIGEGAALDVFQGTLWNPALRTPEYPSLQAVGGYRPEFDGDHLTFVEEPDSSEHRTIAALRLDYLKVGYLRWVRSDAEGPRAGMVADIVVEPMHQRRGVATALWEEAKRLDPGLRHSDAQTPSGEGWARSVGSRPRARVVADITPEQRSPYTPMRENPFDEQTEQGDITDEGPMAAPPPGPQMVPAPMPTMAPMTTRPRGGNADMGPEIGNDVDFMEDQQGFEMTRQPVATLMPRVAAAGEWKVFELTNWPYGGQRLFLAAQEGPEGKNTPLGGILFSDSEIVSINVLDFARGHGVARFLFDAVDKAVGRQLPDDGYRTRAGAGLLNHLGRPKGKFVKWVGESDAVRPFKGVFLNFLFGIPEPEDDPNIKRVATMTTSSMRKGAPFAGYDDFESCVQANSDKDDPEAYCGKIKHQTEGNHRVASRIRLTARDAAKFALSMRRLAGPNSQIQMLRDFEDPMTGFMFEEGTVWDFVGASEDGWQVEVGEVGEIVEVPYEMALLKRKPSRRARRLAAGFYSGGHECEVEETAEGFVAYCTTCPWKGRAWPDRQHAETDGDVHGSRGLREGSRRVMAHDSGDGETLYHCPFCGGGNIIGRADGTVWCEFCQRAFTVQVQPEHSSMPQTVNGQPYEMPGMPGGPPERTEQAQPSPASPEVEPKPEDDLESLGNMLTSDGQWVSASRYVAGLANDLLSEQGQ